MWWGWSWWGWLWGGWTDTKLYTYCIRFQFSLTLNTWYFDTTGCHALLDCWSMILINIYACSSTHQYTITSFYFDIRYPYFHYHSCHWNSAIADFAVQINHLKNFVCLCFPSLYYVYIMGDSVKRFHGAAKWTNCILLIAILKAKTLNF